MPPKHKVVSSNLAGDAMNDYYMNLALKEAKKAYLKKEIPVGAIIVYNGKVIASAHNIKEITNFALGHAEIIAIYKANKKLKSWRLLDCDMYVTLEPCIMCCGAIANARIKNLYYGASDLKRGGISINNTFYDNRLNHKVTVHHNILENECREIITDFFKKLRSKAI